MKPYKILLTVVSSLALLAGCASFDTTVFRLEKTAADTGYAGVQGFNQYYRASTNGAGPEAVAELDNQRTIVWDASRKLSASLGVTDNLREAYTTNTAVKGQLLGSLDGLSGQSSNIVWLINYFRPGTITTNH